MKAIVKNANKKTERPFPKIMISDAKPGVPMDRIVLFSSFGRGVTLVPGKGGKLVFVGEYETDWEMSAFRDFEGSVTLSND